MNFERLLIVFGGILAYVFASTILPLPSPISGASSEQKVTRYILNETPILVSNRIEL
jgi:hypothetical protein